MEYIFGRRDDGVENVLAKGKETTDLVGRTSITRTYDDCTIIDTFEAGKKYLSDKDSEGNFYNWYIITDHSRSVDFSKKLQPQIDENSAAIDEILAMM